MFDKFLEFIFLFNLKNIFYEENLVYRYKLNFRAHHYKTSSSFKKIQISK